MFEITFDSSMKSTTEEISLVVRVAAANLYSDLKKLGLKFEEVYDNQYISITNEKITINYYIKKD